MGEHYIKSDLEDTSQDYIDFLNQDTNFNNASYNQAPTDFDNYQKVSEIELMDFNETVFSVGQVGTIKQSDIDNIIDFTKISISPNDVLEGKYVSVNKKYWGDEGDLTYKILNEDGVVLISENGAGLGYTTLSSLNLNNQTLNESPVTEPTEATYQNQAEKQSFQETQATNVTNSNMDINSTYELKAETGSKEKTENEHTPINQGVNEQTATPSDFDFRHEESNIIASKAKNMGFTDEQIKIAVGISRWETGNYEHLAYGYNYGGVTGSGDLGSQGGYAKYSSADIGMNSYLENLKKNYFDVGLNTVDDIAKKYLGYSNTGDWIKGVKGCMK